MLTTLLKPATGRITVFGTDTTAQPMRVRRMIGYVPQLLSADASLTGRENIELFARLFDVPRAVRGGRVGEALAAMGLTEPADRLVKTYSGGWNWPRRCSTRRACWCWTNPQWAWTRSPGPTSGRTSAGCGNAPG